MKIHLFKPILLALLVVVVSCSDEETTVQSPLEGNWRITAITISNANLQLLPFDNEIVDINFQNDGSFAGSTSVNQYSGTYEIENTTLTMLSFSTTEVQDTSFGAAFYASITEAQVPNTTVAQFSFLFESGDLIITFGDGGEMVLER